MSRMLEALKKLEGRSRRTAPEVLEEQPQAEAPAVRSIDAALAAIEAVQAADPPLEAAESSTFAPAAENVVLEPLPSYLSVMAAGNDYSPVIVDESPSLVLPVVSSEVVLEKPKPCPAPSTAAVSTPPKLPRPASRLERHTSRTICDPLRGEPYRQIAERLAADAEQIAGRTLLLSGVGPVSETHELTLSVAAVLAGPNERVLVIDGDLSRRNLSDQLGLSDERGLGDVLRGDCPLAEAIVATTLDQVSILGPGRAGLILTSSFAERLPGILDVLTSDYRYILIDGGRASDPAAATLARLSDATYLVVRLGSTEAGEAQMALRQFRAASARVLGSIAVG